MDQNNPQTGQYNPQTTDYNPYAQWDEGSSQNSYWLAGVLGAVALGVAAAYLWLRNDETPQERLMRRGDEFRKSAASSAQDLLDQAPDLSDIRERMADAGKQVSETGKHLRKSKEAKRLLDLAGAISAKGALDRLAEMRDTSSERLEEKRDQMADDYLSLMKETEHRRGELVKELASALKRSRQQFEELQNQALELVDDRRLQKEMKDRQKHMREMEDRLTKTLT